MTEDTTLLDEETARIINVRSNTLARLISA
jgi:hypothetical protein